MIEVRCEHCGRVLGELEGKLKIKCRKCGKWNRLEVKIENK